MESLPDELLFRIVHYLSSRNKHEQYSFPINTLNRLESTCQKFHQFFATHEKQIFSTFALSRWGNQFSGESRKSWRAAVKARHIVDSRWKAGRYNPTVKSSTACEEITTMTTYNNSYILAGKVHGQIVLLTKDFSTESEHQIHSLVVWVILVAPDLTCYSCSNDGVIGVFTIGTKNNIQPLKTIQVSTDMLWGMDIDIDPIRGKNMVAVGTSNSELIIYDLAQQKIAHSCGPVQSKGIYDVCLLDNYCFASSFGNDSVRWDLKENKWITKNYVGAAGPLWRDKQLVYSGSKQGTVDCWDIPSDTKLWSLDADDPVSDIKVFQKKIYMASQRKVRVWDLETLEFLYDLHFDELTTRMYYLVVLEDTVACTFGDRVVHFQVNKGRSSSLSEPAKRKDAD